MDNFTLDLTKIGCDEARMKTVMQGFDRFCDSGDRAKRFFGCIEKKDMQYLCREFNYTDRLSFLKGGVVASGIIGVFTIGSIILENIVKNKRSKK